MNLIVDAQWLKERLNDPNVRIADCRFYLAKPEYGKKEYEENHIPGAVYFHLETDLSSPVGVHGGRHPLPNLEKLKETFEKAGIGTETIVVAYDQGDGAYAARLCWLLHFLGHDNAVVLNGGYKGWIEAGFPVEKEIPTFPMATLEISLNNEIMATYEEVKKVVEEKKGETVLIDSRDPNRYLGIEEPIDKKAGHIPGAINKNWTDGLNEGYYKSVSEQEKRFAPFEKTQSIIVYCGSGVTATPNFLALKAAGFTNIKLYVGSFSDWISYDENEVHTGEEA